MRRLYSFSMLLAAILLLGFGAAELRADEGPQPGHVTGQGAFEVKRLPEFLRIQVEILAKARSAKDALAKLQERRQYAKTKLEGMGATADSIEFSEPSVVAEFDQREAQMQAMMAQRAWRMQMGQGKKPAGKPKEAPPVVVSCNLKAQIRLTAPTAEEMLVLTHDLEDRIKAADLGGIKALKQGAPQDEELAQEEMQGMMNGQEEQRVRGQPFITYVNKLPAEDRARALREAFKRAERQASELAAAAGLVLGPVYKLEELPVQNNDVDVPNGMEYFYAQQMARMGMSPSTDEKNINEAVGLKPAKVIYRVGITASFEMRRLRAR